MLENSTIEMSHKKQRRTNPEVHHGICEELTSVYTRKNNDYGDSFNKARRDVPNYTLGKLYDKFERYKTLTTNQTTRQVADETLEDTLLDLANYCIMEVMAMREDNGQVEMSVKLP